MAALYRKEEENAHEGTGIKVRMQSEPETVQDLYA